MIMFDRRLIKNFGWALFLMTLAFSAVSLLNLYSASYETGLVYFKKQLVWVGVGMLTLVLVSFLNYRFLKQYSIYIYVLSILLLLYVLVFGKAVAGSKSWIDIASIATIQPSELVKISVIIILARFYDNDYQPAPYGFLDLIKPIIYIAIPFALILLQPDLGTALTLLLVSGSMVLFMGVKKWSVAFILIVVLGVSFYSWNYTLKPYQKDRIRTFINPSSDPLDAGYNSIQSQIAVGSGGVTGKGLRAGSQTQLRFIPAQQTDFAFSVLAEEWGFLGSIFVLLLYFMIILWMLDTSSRAKDRFTMLVCFGIGAMFFWHVVVNVGMVIGILPVTGVPLLIFSYGGSSTLTAMIGIGIVLGIRMRKFSKSGEAIDLG
jgi:rod shape determining protein RodA